ncbi:MAG: C1 family peptidase, partial [Frankiaceae bacterium]
DYQPQGNTDWRTQPTPLQRSKARAHRTTGARFLYASWPGGPGPGARRLISNALAGGHPVALSFAAYPGFMTLGGRGASFRLADAKGRSLGGHQALVVGYDSFGVRIQNSWGRRWGDAGYARLSWDFVAAHSFDASVMDGFVGR